MTAQEVLEELRPLGRESYKKILKNHGVQEPFFGVPISELKLLQKRIRKDYQLALDLYETGNYDAMYLAGLIADDPRMTRTDLQRWVEQANGGSLPGTTVPGVAAGNPEGLALALEWIESPKPLIAFAGWTTLSLWVAVKPDAELDLAQLKDLLARVQASIHAAPNDVRYGMNTFVISVGCYVRELNPLAMKIGMIIGPVAVDMGETSCQVPFAPESIAKVEKRGTIGKKRKNAKC